MSNRRATEKWIVDFIHELLPDDLNRDLYVKYFAKLNDRQFADFIAQLKAKKIPLRIRIPNGSKVKLSVDRNLQIADRIGLKLFKHLHITDPTTGVVHKTPKKYLVGPLVVRRLAQTLINKISIASDNLHVDQLTDQPTGPSKTSKISAPEAQMIHAQGLSETLVELLKTRGGDRKQFNAANRVIFREGRVSQRTISQIPSKVKATETLSILLKGQHLDNNL